MRCAANPESETHPSFGGTRCWLVSPVKMWIAGSVPWLPDGVAAACGRCQVAACVCLCVCVCVPRLCEVWHVVRLWVSAPRPRLLDGLTSPGNRAAVPCPVGEDKAVSTVDWMTGMDRSEAGADAHNRGGLGLGEMERFCSASSQLRC